MRWSELKRWLAAESMPIYQHRYRVGLGAKSAEMLAIAGLGEMERRVRLCGRQKLCGSSRRCHSIPEARLDLLIRK